MDSMRSLNTSLPTSGAHSARPEPPEQLLQAFKTAALSVTNLYKNAVADQINSRHAGYQEALEDLRGFLDRERIGLEDGEAMKIRNWILERIDGTACTASDSDDDRPELDKGSEAQPVSTSRKEGPDVHQPSLAKRSVSPSRPENLPQPRETTSDHPTATRPPTFTFTAAPQFPQYQMQDIDMQIADNTAPSTTTLQHDSHSASVHNVPSPTPSVRVEVVPRAPRTPHRLNTNNRHNTRSSTRDVTSNTTSKRKLHFADFFDISSVGNGKDTFGGGKRGRFI